MKVLIAGGGVGGLAAALALERAGADVTVFERRRAPEPRLGLHVWANGIRALEQLGLARELVPARPLTQRAEFRSAGGRLLAEWDLRARAAELGAPTVGLERDEIVDALTARLQRTTVLRGHACVSYKCAGLVVAVELDNGTVETGDVLIGADGAGSAIAAQLRGPLARRAAPSVVWHGVATGADATPEPGTLGEWFGPGARFVCFETGSGQWSWARIQPGHAPQRAFPRIDRWDPVVRALVAATPSGERHRVECWTARRRARWGAGRVTLLGDAAHPMGTGAGQGIGQALEDAVALARRLGGAPDPVPALRAYEAERRPRAQRQQALAARLEALGGLDGRLSCAIRDRFVAATWQRIGLRRLLRDLADDGALTLASP